MLRIIVLSTNTGFSVSLHQLLSSDKESFATVEKYENFTFMAYTGITKMLFSNWWEEEFIN